MQKNKTNKYKNRKFAKGLKETIQFYVKKRLGIYEPGLVKIITEDLKEEELQRLIEDKKDYKKYKENIEKKQKELKKKQNELDKLDSRGSITRSQSRNRYTRENIVYEIDRLKPIIRDYEYQIKLLKEKYPNTDLSN